MKYFSFLATACAATIAAAAPTVNNPLRRADGSSPSDLQVLQYALTLEHLEATFYAQALDKFDAQAFQDAGFPDWVRGRVSQIAQHEKSHVALLSAALGNDSVAACQYSFPYNDVRSFLVFACGLENIGVSAYAGANKYISDPLYSTVAATILPVEARHQGFFYGPVLTHSDWTGPYDTPLGLDMVYTLAAQLITSCPSSNAMLPVKSFGPLTMNGSPIINADAGATITLNYKDQFTPGTYYAIVYNGLGASATRIIGGQMTLPQGLQGYSYAIVTTASDPSAVNPSNVIAGPIEIQTAFDAFVSNPGFMNPYGA